MISILFVEGDLIILSGLLKTENMKKAPENEKHVILRFFCLRKTLGDFSV